MDVRLNISYEQVYRSQNVCISGPMCNDLFFNVVICRPTITSHNIGHLILATTELGKYAFWIDVYCWDFLLSSEIRSEGSIAIVKIFDSDFLMIFHST